MDSLKYATKLIGILVLLQFYSVTAQNTNYPNIDAIYTQTQLEDLVKKYERKRDTLGLAYTYWAYAKNQEKVSGMNTSPLTNFRKSMECFRAIKDSSNFYDVRGAIGSYFMDRPFIKQYAQEYIQSAVDYFRTKKKYSNEIGHLINLANINIHNENYVLAQQMLQRVEFLNTKIHDEAFRGRLHSSYSDLYARQKQYEKAMAHAKISLDIGKRLKIDWLEALSLYFTAKCLEGLNRYDEMMVYLEESLKVTENNVNLIQLRESVYDNLHYYYYRKKNYTQAYAYAIRTKQTLETIYFSKIESDVRSFNEYRLLENQKIIISKIALEKKLAEIELDKLRSRQQLYIVTIILTLLFLLLFTYIFINRRRLSRLKAIQIDKNLHIETLNALINGQESERVRVAQELHDGLGTMLSRMKILAGRGLPQEKITQMIDEACSEVRNISGNLQPNTLSNFGLIRAVQDLVFKQNSTEPIIIFQYFGEPFEIENKKSLMVYRIIQELLANSLKHAQATEILIQVIFSEDNNITLTVEDDGVGFDENQVKTDSNGWTNIRSRVNYLSGTINLYTDKGTSVTISIPFSGE
ncbi:ATP-binding protein [Arcicella sp. LKC2W]|uniref:tetratricopeptide repeat-containing sensor histidine kinase n=1 Tax=Arcicella sp. LKC2W TaxID=2984198 RepID=UPI002B1FEC12|nr:ATP-binding protein [Arcicella sp. LKC2W]MEA5459748.1 ATP-binding protein [Arcicella sp. LKC2W]